MESWEECNMPLEKESMKVKKFMQTLCRLCKRKHFKIYCFKRLKDYSFI